MVLPAPQAENGVSQSVRRMGVRVPGLRVGKSIRDLEKDREDFHGLQRRQAGRGRNAEKLPRKEIEMMADWEAM